ncbi:MAG: hypothetical protein FWG68_12190 [Defluviitaleaceae bacterium]|nr:hypothetical protein [Defluviitaleaceae bacterium]
MVTHKEVEFKSVYAQALEEGGKKTAAEYSQKLAEKDSQLAEKDNQIAELKRQIATLQNPSLA